MATYYWVGGDGNWSDATNHWSNSSGGSPNASYLPTSADDVIFDANSNVGTGTFTVTVDGTSASPSLCADFSTGGGGGALDGVMTLSIGAAELHCYGSMTLPASNFTYSPTVGAILYFKATTTGKTLTTNGVSLAAAGTIIFDGVGGGWSLGSALTAAGITVTNGTFSTSASNYSITATALASSNSNTRTISLNASTVTLSGTAPLTFTTSTNLTLNAGTSTITCSNASPTFAGGGLTFYNVTFSSVAAGTAIISGANTYNNLTFTSRSATGQKFVSLIANQTVSGTLTLGAANTAIRRIAVFSSVIGTQRTITLNGTLATLSDVDFRDIVAAGSAGTWSGTRLGNGLNNSNITFVAGKTVYWNLAGSQNWSATAWATTNNGAPSVNNFPLSQDTAVFTEAGSAGTVTWDAGWFVGAIQMADGVSNRTTAFTLATSTVSVQIYGNVTLFSNLTLSGTGIIFFVGQGTTQTVTSAGITFTQSITVTIPSGTVKIADNFTQTSATGFTHNSGTVDLNSKTLTCYLWSSNNSITRSILFGTGKITVTGNNALVWSTATGTNFTYSGTSNVDFNYSGSTGTRTVAQSALSLGGGTATALNMTFSAGSDTITFGGSGRIYQNTDFTGFTGTYTNTLVSFIGNLTFSTGMTVGSGANTVSFSATSGTQTITTNGKTLDFPLQFNGSGGTVSFADALTMGSSQFFIIADGATVKLKSGVTSTVSGFLTSGTSQKYLQSTTAGTQATISQASGTVNANYLYIQDSNATGGATWIAPTTVNINLGNNSGWSFTPTGIASRITNTGILYTPFNSLFDEITMTKSSISPNATYSSTFDEVTLQGQNIAKRETSTGQVHVSGYLDEVTGIY
jgi:hypothetical protein